MVLMQLVLPIKVGATIRLLPVSLYNTAQYGVGRTVLPPEGLSSL